MATRNTKTARRGTPSRRPAGARRAPANGATKNGRAATGRQAAWEGQRAAWEARYAQSKERPGLYPFTISGIPIKPLYSPEDLVGLDLARDLAHPGEYPFTRGI